MQPRRRLVFVGIEDPPVRARAQKGFRAVRGIERAYTPLANQSAMSLAARQALFRRIRIGDHVKTTWPGRFDELDQLTAEQVELRFPPGQPIHVHDIAASDASTSVDLFRRLSETRPVTMKASDYYDAVLYVRLSGVDFFFHTTGEPLQLAIGQWAMSMQSGPWRLLTAPAWPLARRRLGEAQRISLHHPEALRLAATDPAFRLVREDFYDPARESFDVVRLANAIMPSQTLEQKNRIIGAVAESIKDGGLLIFGRTQHYSIYKREDDRFAEVATLGKGAEDAEVVRLLMKSLEN